MNGTPINTGGPAFPGQMRTGFDPRSGEFNEGMTLRDYFAGQALVSLSRHILYDQTVEDTLKADGLPPECLPDFLGAIAYQVADAAIRARDKEPLDTRVPIGKGGAT